jgi:hypothetical protein
MSHGKFAEVKSAKDRWLAKSINWNNAATFVALFAGFIAFGVFAFGNLEFAGGQSVHGQTTTTTTTTTVVSTGTNPGPSTGADTGSVAASARRPDSPQANPGVSVVAPGTGQPAKGPAGSADQTKGIAASKDGATSP